MNLPSIPLDYTVLKQLENQLQRSLPMPFASKSTADRYWRLQLPLQIGGSIWRHDRACGSCHLQGCQVTRTTSEVCGVCYLIRVISKARAAVSIMAPFRDPKEGAL